MGNKQNGTRHKAQGTGGLCDGAQYKGKREEEGRMALKGAVEARGTVNLVHGNM